MLSVIDVVAKHRKSGPRVEFATHVMAIGRGGSPDGRFVRRPSRMSELFTADLHRDGVGRGPGAWYRHGSRVNQVASQY